MIEPGANAIRFSHHSLQYDHRETAAKLRNAGLPEGYAATLETGLWPSLDILPAAEAALTGKPISLADTVWQAALAEAI